MRIGLAIAISTLTLLAAGGAGAKDKRPAAATPAIDAILRCRAIAETDKRIACYDASAATLADAVQQRSIVVLDREEVKQDAAIAVRFRPA